MKHQKKGQHKNNKKFKGKGNDSKQTIAKKELKFAPVSNNANFATYDTVKDALLLEIQAQSFKSKAIIVEAIREEKEPTWDSKKPERYFASFDPVQKSYRKETLLEKTERVTLEQQQSETIAARVRASREEGKTAEAADQPAELPEEIKQLVKTIQEGYDAEWNIQMKVWHEMQREYTNDELAVYSIM